ncbi:Uncharacterised protein [Enterobacter cloacae]|nr:Uncharacterised protein [Enterobacter cloacae]
MTLLLAEHLANGVGIAPKVFGIVTLNLFAVFCRQQQVLNVAVVSVHLQHADSFVLFAGNVVAQFVGGELCKKLLTEGHSAHWITGVFIVVLADLDTVISSDMLASFNPGVAGSF